MLVPTGDSGPRESTAVVDQGDDTPAGAPLSLLVICQDQVGTHPLGDGGQLTIGRSEEADVRIDDAKASRNHARLHVGPPLRVEDLGSSNGTRVRDERLAAGQLVEVAVGEAIHIGSTILMVQRMVSTGRPRRIWPHGYFEGRLEEECARAQRSGAAFAVLRMFVDRAPAGAAVEQLLADEFRPADVLAAYGPGDYEILLVDTTAAEAADVTRRVSARLAGSGIVVRSGFACYPADGRTPEALVSRVSALTRGSGEPAADGDVVIADDGMRRLYQLVERIAAGTINVLILGETGVGKEVLARAVHQLSPRAGAQFLGLSCATLAENLLESELFGHERGAFTGAVKAKAGLLETARGGTVFLDEVGELPLPLQAKLLRVLEMRQVLRLGGLKPRAIDVRFVAATNRDLEAEVARGAFREDLYFRLNGFTLMVPPLRDRPAEIEALARQFLAAACRQGGRTREPRISAPVMALLRSYGWPGNIRELRNLIDRAVLLCGSDEITLEHLPVEKMHATVAVKRARPAPGAPPPGAAPLGERDRILAALDACAGNQSRAAKLLGMPRRTFCAKLDAHGIPRPRKGRER